MISMQSSTQKYLTFRLAVPPSFMSAETGYWAVPRWLPCAVTQQSYRKGFEEQRQPRVGDIRQPGSLALREIPDCH